MTHFGTAMRVMTAALVGASALTAAHAQRVTSIGPNNTLATFGGTRPTDIVRTRRVTGLAAGDTLLGIDARPASPRVFYANSVDSAGTSSQLYAINVNTGAATAVGSRIALPAGVTGVGYDFNPSADRLRVVLSNGDSLRLNQLTGAVVGTDADVFFRPGDPNAGDAPNIVGAAYTNPVRGAPATTLYVIDATNGVLAIQGGQNVTGTSPPGDSPNTGTLTTVGALGVPVNGVTGFNITSDGRALATITDQTTGVTSVYQINLATGRAKLLGQIGGGAGGAYNGLAFQLDPYTTASRSANQFEVAGTLDRYVGIPSARVALLFAYIDALPDIAAKSDALDQLSPRGYAQLPDLAFQTSEFIDTSVRRYMRDVRAGGTGTDDPNRQQGADRALGFWLTGSGRFGKLSGSAVRNRTEYGATGVIGGLDYRFSPTAFVGAFGGYDLGEARLNRLSPNSSMDAWFVGGYGSFGLGPFYVDVHGSYADTTHDLRRNLAFGGYTAQNRANARSDQWTVAGTIGLTTQFGGIEAEPYGGVRFIDLSMESFSELGSSSRLAIGSANAESLQSIAGLRLGTQFPAGRAIVRASLRGEYRHEFENDQRVFNSRFKEPTLERSVRFVTDPLDRDFAVVGGGFTVSGPTSPLSFFADYSGQISGGYDIHGVQGGLRLTF